MKIPKFITFSGIDDRTDLDRASKLAEQYPIEWGVLLSDTNKDSRYPSYQGRQEILQIAGMKSGHLCGRLAKNIISMYTYTSNPPDQTVLDLLNTVPYSRFQINSIQYPEFFMRKLQDKDQRPFIIQWRNSNTFAADDLFPTEHHMLYDCSGGRGRLAEKFPPIITNTFVGYAGGISPDNVVSILEKIEGDGDFWIDMETGVRTNGWFDLDKVQQVCEKVYG